MDCRTRLQLAEMLGSDNKWYCSQANGREVRDCDTLIAHYVRTGGATDFARRFNQAMGELNYYYCCRFYRKNVTEPDVLFHYYMHHAPLAPYARNRRPDPIGVTTRRIAG